MTTPLSILQHALGRDGHGRRKNGASDDYRNHFCTSPPGEDWDRCIEAVALGLMTKHDPREISGWDSVFTVTAAGKAYIDEHSPAPPKVSRSKARYLKWLAIGDAYDVSFGDWLKEHT